MEYSGHTKVELAKFLPERFNFNGKNYSYLQHPSCFTKDGLLVNELDSENNSLGMVILEFDKVYQIVHGKEPSEERQVESIQVEPQNISNKNNKTIDEDLRLTPPPIPKNISKKTYQFDESIKENEEFVNNKKKSIQYRRQRMFSKAFSFKGRIGRTEYGITFIVCAFLLAILKVLLDEEELALLLFAYIPIYWFLFAQGAKRCHDMGQNGWYQIIPLYPIWLIFGKGEEGLQNKYGINPKIKT